MAKYLNGVALAACFLLSTSVVSAEENSQGQPKADLLTGDAKSACEMVLCLSAAIGKSLPECANPLKKYKKMDSDDRPGFLKKCPMVK